MKTKTIKSYLVKRFNKWIDSIEDEKVQELARKNSIITGGAITSLLMNEPPRDIDIYFRSKETVKAIAEYYCDQWNKSHGRLENHIGRNEAVFVIDGEDVERWKNGEIGINDFCPNYDQNYPEYMASRMIGNTAPDRIKIIFPSDGVVGEVPEEVQQDQGDLTPEKLMQELDEIPAEALPSDDEQKPHRPVFLTTNAIALSGKIQLVVRFYGEPEEIHETYDFVHCCCYWDSANGDLVTPEKSLLAILNKDLFYMGSKYPVCSVFRSRKFIQRGWTINAGQYLKMCFQISQLDLTNVDVLEDQLVGVDTLYFQNIIRSLQAKMSKDPDFKITADYVTSIVDKIF